MPVLKIGDEQNAILILQQTQTDPQKAVAELVENSIDAGAKHITITRSRKGGQVCLVVADDGEGVKAAPNGDPDFDYLTSHICDSIKRNLDRTSREGIQGQFGIGLLGFAAVGEELILRSKRQTSRTHAIALYAYESKEYRVIDPPDRQLRHAGTEAEIRGVRREVQNRLTAEKLHRYLGEELRDRIRKSGVRIHIDDSVGVKKALTVTPKEFAGIPLNSGQKEIDTEHGKVVLDLYAAFPKEGDRAQVSIARNGTRLLPDVLECEELRHSPWTLNILEGVIDCEGLAPSPATRRGFVPDQAYQSLVDHLRAREPGLELELNALRKRQEEKLGKEFMEKLQRAFAEAMDELSEDYSWFEKTGSGFGDGGPRQPGPGHKPKPVTWSPGPLEEVRIRPKIAVIGLEERRPRPLVAKAFDPNGAVIPSGVSYQWSTTSTLLALKPTGQAVTVEARGKEGEALVVVVARLKGRESRAQSKVVVTKSQNRYGFPPPDPINAPMEFWRSRYVAERGVLEYNTGHRDYERVMQAGEKAKLRYMGKLYAKELVLLNFNGGSSSQLLERMVEVTSLLEPRL